MQASSTTSVDVEVEADFKSYLYGAARCFVVYVSLNDRYLQLAGCHAN